MKQEFIKHARIFLLSLSLLMSFILINAQDRITGKTFATRSEVIASHGMAATSQPLATMVAIDILKKGGKAIEAANAANAMMALIEPSGRRPGGDLFAIIWDAKTSKLYGLNASGRSPLSLTLDYFIYTLEGTPDKLDWKVNDRSAMIQNQGVLQDEMYVGFSAGITDPVPDHMLPASMDIDWVRIYKKKE